MTGENPSREDENRRGARPARPGGKAMGGVMRNGLRFGLPEAPI